MNEPTFEQRVIAADKALRKVERIWRGDTSDYDLDAMRQYLLAAFTPIGLEKDIPYYFGDTLDKLRQWLNTIAELNDIELPYAEEQA